MFKTLYATCCLFELLYHIALWHYILQTNLRYQYNTVIIREAFTAYFPISGILPECLPRSMLDKKLVHSMFVTYVAER